MMGLMLIAVCLLNFVARGTPYIPSSTIIRDGHRKTSADVVLFSALEDDSFDGNISPDSKSSFGHPFLNTYLRQSKDMHSPVSGLFSDRRGVLAALLAASTIQQVPTARAAEIASMEPNLDCLLDLPPIPNDCVRIYLCRHGQTENNRLRLVQGARVDPPINGNGEAMACRLGTAFSRLDGKCPQTIMHSTLLRAKQTAQVASKEMGGESIRLETLPSLGEVDFGPMSEGKKVSEAKPAMIETYGRWSAGLIDTRPDGGGDSARDILERASAALQSLINVANESDRNSVVAVSHSTYLRMLLAVLLDMPLAQAATLTLKNGCINVVDFKKDGRTRAVASKSRIFGGPLSQAPSDFNLTVPRGDVLRVNEDRHLVGLV